MRYENTDLVHLVLVATKPADAGKTSRPVRAGGSVSQLDASSPTYTEKYDEAVRLSDLPLLQTHYGVKAEA